MRPRLSSSARTMVLMSPCHRYRAMRIAVDCCVGVSAEVAIIIWSVMLILLVDRGLGADDGCRTVLDGVS